MTLPPFWWLGVVALVILILRGVCRFIREEAEANDNEGGMP